MNTRDIAAPKELTDSSALIVGGTAGIGLATAVGLAQAGVPRIMIVGRGSERGASARERISSANSSCDVTFLSADATTVDGATHIALQAERVLEGVDILVSTTAADTRPELFANIPTDDIARIFDQLALPCMYLASEIVPHMTARKAGVIINVASDAAKTATPGEAVIGAAKAAIVMFTRTLAIEAKRNGIRVNVLTPSLVAGTGSTERITSDGFSAKLFAKAAQQAHLGVPESEDLAALAVFLASPAARRLTGQAISVNGGISAA
ncbi:MULTISPECIES: SDR family NAD(P)-dependent oxidoreductase [Rhodococcus]|uniref:3-oxoacyl-[acyl-carrier-protein] reductase MabA n=1 Tax=Rhodococcus indonesiensis TaxID=3055869 RepID=A0ABT7RL31_9NOCA|nr:MULTISPECIES: SDR family oxidoreductase [Rhodococcus]AUM16608.1 oxidoreductase [Rhodococcus ruber]AXY50587.1 3-oxoacyl-[acyl-carrier protein] [Rhodococcus ruber]MBD8052156.1 SDR family oxidoreductase [Rhodococcus ruber]MBP2210032.1 NAD(P)-dependent dehydrogenase (short-subunit alcohol dehydrogenase family) [Rhodococcus ruber]MCF8786061.1 SDR family oxidoreductase [Rhodococcus ruber]